MRIGIDLGGSKIEVAALDRDGSIRLRRRVPTPTGDYAATIAALKSLIESSETELGMRASIGIAIPGTVSPATGLVKNANSTCLIGRPFDRDVASALGRPVRLANDANCFALSEARDGAAQGAQVVFGAILGTGVGGGLVVGGRVLTGANAIAGEWGHNPLPSPTSADLPLRSCYCGRAGCIETYLCGPALERDDAITLYEERLARALATVINILDPDVVVLGGGVSNLERLYHSVPRLWSRYIFSDHVATRLARNVHGDSSGVRGAAWLWER